MGRCYSHLSVEEREGLGARRGDRRARVLLPAAPSLAETHQRELQRPDREFFPKGKSLDDVADEEVQRVCDMLNRRPRKCLGWKCPYEVFYGVSLHLI